MRYKMGSKVLAKDRTISKFKFFSGFLTIMDKCFNYFYNFERFDMYSFNIFCVPILNTISNIQQNLIIANGIYPINEHEVMIRRDFQNIAINQLDWCLNWIEFTSRKLSIEIEKDNALKDIINSIYDELDYLKVWRRQNNSLMKKFRELNSNEKFGIVAAESKLAMK